MGTANAAGQALDQPSTVVRKTGEVRIAGVLLPPDARVVGDDGIVATQWPILIELGAQTLDRFALGQAGNGY